MHSLAEFILFVAYTAVQRGMSEYYVWMVLTELSQRPNAMEKIGLFLKSVLYPPNTLQNPLTLDRIKEDHINIGLHKPVWISAASKYVLIGDKVFCPKVE